MRQNWLWVYQGGVAEKAARAERLITKGRGGSIL